MPGLHSSTRIREQCMRAADDPAGTLCPQMTTAQADRVLTVTSWGEVRTAAD